MQSDSDNIRYVAVCRLHDRVAIAEYCATYASDLPRFRLDEKLRKVLRSDRVTEHKRLTITDREVGSIHYDSDSTCLYMVVCSKEYQQRLAFKFLAEVRQEFGAKFGDEVSTARETSLSRASKELLMRICMTFNTPSKGDNIKSVAVQVEAVKGQMTENIQSVLRNTENVEKLVDQSDSMTNEANTFNKSAMTARKRTWWQNQKISVFLFVGMLLLVAVIVVPIVRSSSSSEPAA